jgi:NADPH-dependent curcumin reductase CurA
MRGFICGEVVASAAPEMPVGAVVMGLGTWSQYSRVPAACLMPVPELPGLSRKDVFGQGYIVAPTALLGLRHIGSPKAGETMLVSAAAGAVGSLAGQIGKAWGCKVIGLAGDAEKRDWITRDLGFDLALDYRGDDFAQRLRAACPNGIDIFYDNVAGNVLDVVLGQMKLRGRVVQCGLISSYNDDLHGQSFRNYGCIVTQRLRIEGFIVIDWFDEYPAMFREVADLHASGKLKWRYHDVDGLGQAVDAVKLLFQGRNRGKMIVRL